MRVAKSSARANERMSVKVRISGRKRRLILQGDASSDAMTVSTARVGINLKNEITVADNGRTKRGKAEFKINFPPLVMDFAPIVKEFVTR